MIETLLEKPCWVIDFLPRQVPADSAGQVFAVERFYLQKPQLQDLRRRFAEILLKINCYADLMVCTPDTEDWQRNPAPEQLVSWVLKGDRDLCILLPAENTLFTLNRDDLSMAVFNPSAACLQLLDRLATAAGLFLWQPPQQGKETLHAL